MDFDPSFRGPFPYLSSLFPENLHLKPEIPTMFPLQSSTPFPPPPNNRFFHPNTPHHFQDHIFNVPSHPPHFVMEGPSSITNTNPFYGISTPCLGESSVANRSLRDFVNLHSPVTFAPNNKMDALHGNRSGKVIWDFEQKTAIQTTATSCSQTQKGLSFSQSPSPVSDEYGSVLRARLEEELACITRNDHWDTDGDGERRQDKRVKVESDSNIANTTKGQWTPEEDRVLVELVKEYGLKKWSQIAKLLNGRVGKQCRERWHNHLRPNIRKDSWTVEEDIKLIKAHQEVGNKWAEIARRLPGRTENTIKNHWNAIKRRQNTKKLRNKPSASDGSLLQAYIKKVTATEAAAKELKKSINRMKMLSRCNDLALLVRSYEFSDDDFSSEDWATEVFGQENEDLGLSLQHHDVFTASGNGGLYPPLQFNNADGTANGSVVNGGNFYYGDGMKKEMDLIEMISARY